MTSKSKDNRMLTICSLRYAYTEARKHLSRYMFSAFCNRGGGVYNGEK